MTKTFLIWQQHIFNKVIKKKQKTGVYKIESFFKDKKDFIQVTRLLKHFYIKSNFMNEFVKQEMFSVKFITGNSNNIYTI